MTKTDSSANTHRFYQDLSRITMDILTKAGVPRKTAQGLSDKISEGIRQELSGLMVYTPKTKESTKERNEKIKQLYDEGLLSHAQLALRFDVSIRQIYRILK